MPIMVRSKKSKAAKIAFDILGTPTNLQSEKISSKKRKVAQKIFFDVTKNVR